MDAKLEPTEKRAASRRVRPDPWADTTAYIADDAAEVVELSASGDRIQIVDDPDAADIKIRVRGLSTGAARSAARDLAQHTI